MPAGPAVATTEAAAAATTTAAAAQATTMAAATTTKPSLALVVAIVGEQGMSALMTKQSMSFWNGRLKTQVGFNS